MWRTLFGIILFAIAGNAHASIDGRWAGLFKDSLAGEGSMKSCRFGISRTATKLVFEDNDRCFYFPSLAETNHGEFTLDGTNLILGGKTVGTVDDGKIEMHYVDPWTKYDFTAVLGSDDTLTVYEHDDEGEAVDNIQGTASHAASLSN